MSVGGMKDYKLKLRNLHSSHTLSFVVYLHCVGRGTGRNT
jgi:hypothetical protein